MNLILITQLIVSILLITVIQLQSKGSGLGSAFGGAGKSYHSKRGMEKVLFRFTIGLSVLFILISVLALI